MSKPPLPVRSAAATTLPEMSKPWPPEWDHYSPEEIFEPHDERRWPKRRKPRRTSIRSMIAAAEKAGKTVSSITVPGGTVLHFATSEAAPASDNPWDAAAAQ